MVLNRNYEIKTEMVFMPKELALNNNLSPYARSLLFYMLGMPCETVFNLTVLRSISGYTEKKTKEIIQELVRNGYMKSIKQKDNRGCFLRFDYIVTYIPFVFGDEDFIKYNNGELNTNLHTLYDTIKSEKQVGYVYLIKMDSHYKIGISKNPKRRLKAFSTMPQEVEVILTAKVNDYARIEEELHEKYKEKRVRGEWFELDDLEVKEITDYLTSIKVDI
jgi:hypothetical protein